MADMWILEVDWPPVVEKFHPLLRYPHRTRGLSTEVGEFKPIFLDCPQVVHKWG
jgi:hypothetical protein